MKNFSVGKEINRLLKNNVQGLGDKVFPLIANPNTTFPFLVYRRIGFVPRSNKDYMGEQVTMELNIASEKYEEGVDIANDVADLLQNKETDIIETIQLVNVTEMYLQDTFIQNLQIRIVFK